MLTRVIVFLLLNFGALAIGGIFAGDGVVSNWYMELDKAPWTPPGWVFGAVWTLIMACFTWYMAVLWSKLEEKREAIVLYGFQWILNVAWNPLFFFLHQVSWALLVIGVLTLLVSFFLFYYRRVVRMASWLILPYVIWLWIASSLNAYIWVNN